MTSETSVGSAMGESPSVRVSGLASRAPASAPATSTAVPARPRHAPADWRAALARRLTWSDFAVIVVVVVVTHVLWFGSGNEQLYLTGASVLDSVPYWMVSAGLVALWMLVLSLIDSRSDRVLGTGAAEYMLVISATFRLFGVIAIIAFLLKADIARGYLLISLPLGMMALVLERWLWRQWLKRRRRGGGYAARVLLVGPAASVAHLASELRRDAGAGFEVVGACFTSVPQTGRGQEVLDPRVPVVGSVDRIRDAIDEVGADTVAITSADELSPQKVKRISWELAQGREHLVLAPSLVDIAGPRIHVRPVAGLPLIHVETPRFSRGQRVTKRGVDVVASALGLLLLSPLLAVLAIVIRATSEGPVLFRQERVGLAGRTFQMLKFRSMVDGAEAMLPELLAQERDAGNEVLFKLKRDPRVTRVGAFMRRFSLDELPQLLNVLRGTMSLVGPRPSLPSEVERYADHVHRRFLVKPGITGLWQVSGRSNLSWEDSVRLDLSYVDNWTLAGDLVILARTARAALAPGETAF